MKDGDFTDAQMAAGYQAQADVLRGGSMKLTRTTWVLIIGLVLIVTYELIAAIGHQTPTISQYVWHISELHPTLPFGIGVGVGYLGGHFFAR